MSRNLRCRIERLERRRSAEQSTPKVSSFWDVASAACQGRNEDANALWVQLPEETRAIVEVALGSPDPLQGLEGKINAPLLGLPCGLRGLLRRCPESGGDGLTAR
jgi:hypothetical protein